MGGRLFLYIILTLLTSTGAWSQSNVQLTITTTDKSPDFLLRKFDFPQSVQDSVQAFQELTQLKDRIIDEGFLAASIDSVVYSEEQITAIVFFGPQYYWSKLDVLSEHQDLVQIAGRRFQPGDKFRYTDLDNLMDQMLFVLENRGYPFATCYLDTIEIVGNKISADLVVGQNQFVQIDTLLLEGGARIRAGFLESYLEITPGSPYHEENISRISQRMRNLSFVTGVEEPEVLFTANDRARVTLYAQNRKSSQFNLLLGFLPNSGESGNLLLTGEARLNLVNPFGTGKEIFLDWKKLQARTQRLVASFRYPYFFGLPLGLNTNFDLYKRDTFYVDLNWDIGIQYQFSSQRFLEISFRNQTTSLLNVDSAVIVNASQLPEFNDLVNTALRIRYVDERLDYQFNPTSGYSISIGGSIGVKSIKVNQAIANVINPSTGETFQSLYDTLDLRTVQYKLDIDLQKFWPLGKRSTLLSRARARAIFGPSIFQNEEFRLGGANLLRGFDEESVFTPYYSILTLEYRFLLEQNSYFYAFSDLAVVKDIRPGFDIDWPVSFGVGIALETKAGIFGLSYAVGRQLDNAISFSNGKIHFGYLGYF